nr:hypothetical protein [Pseudomonas sp. GM48]
MPTKSLLDNRFEGAPLREIVDHFALADAGAVCWRLRLFEIKGLFRVAAT